MKDKKKKDRGFTLVEVLICVGIVGIIAAIMIPSLLSSTSTKALETQRKALYSRMSQAFAQIKNLKAYETSAGNSASSFIATGLGKVYRVTYTCNNISLNECGIPDEVYDYYDDSEIPLTTNLKLMDTLSKLNPDIPIADWGGLDTTVAGFKTANGESILLYYNPRCMSKTEAEHNLVRSVCVNMIYDLNGKTKAPNTYGEDIGYITVFYPTDPVVVAPIIDNKNSWNDTYAAMLSTAEEKELLPPTLEELTSILINKELTHVTRGTDANKPHWSSTFTNSGADLMVWTAGITDGVKKTLSVTASETPKNPFYLIKK